MNVNPNTVILLTKTNLKTMIVALTQRDVSLIEKTDGTKPTPEELALIMSATRDEFYAANDLIRRYAEAAVAKANVSARLRDMFIEYSMSPDDTTIDARSRMPQEVRDEFDRIAIIAFGEETML